MLSFDKPLKRYTFSYTDSEGVRKTQNFEGLDARTAGLAFRCWADVQRAYNKDMKLLWPRLEKVKEVGWDSDGIS